MKNPPGILARDGDELVYRYTPHYRHSLGDLAHEGWLVPLPPMGDRSQVGPVRFQQNPVERRLANGIVQAPVLEGDHSAEGHIVAEDQAGSQESHAAAERVENDSDVGMRGENGRHVVIRVAGVNDRRFAGLGRERKLRFKGTVLERAG